MVARAPGPLRPPALGDLARRARDPPPPAPRSAQPRPANWVRVAARTASGTRIDAPVPSRRPARRPPVNPATALARALLAELVHQGVRDVVLAPGSRSAPLAFEALRLDRAGRIRLHVRIDERSAGFLALGLAKVSGTPVAVICTSGTAVANLAPAVVEASYSAIPLVVLSADRPVESRGVGAPQTIDQVEFFGRTVRFFADLGAARRIDPEDPDAAQRAARASAGMAIAAAVGSPARRVRAASAGAGWPTPDRCTSTSGSGSRWCPTRTTPDQAPAPPDARRRTGRLPVPARRRRPPLTGCDHRDAREVLGELPARGVILAGDLPCTSLRGHHQWLAALADGLRLADRRRAVGEPARRADGPRARGPRARQRGVPGRPRPGPRAHRRAVRPVPAHDGPDPGGRPARGDRAAHRRPRGVRPAADGRAGAHRDPAASGRVHPGSRVARRLAGRRRGRRRGRGRRAGGATGALTGSAVAAQVWSQAPDDALLLVAASWPVRQVEMFAGRRDRAARDRQPGRQRDRRAGVHRVGRGPGPSGAGRRPGAGAHGRPGLPARPQRAARRAPTSRDRTS